MKRLLYSFLAVALATGAAFLASCEKQSPLPSQSSTQPAFSVTESASPAIVFCDYITKKSTQENQIVVMNADGSNQTVVYTSSTIEPMSPAWSSDAKHSSFWNSLTGDLYTADISVVKGVPGNVEHSASCF